MFSAQRTGFLLLAISAVGYAFLPIFTKYAYEAGLGALDFASWRFIIAVPVVWLLVMLVKQRQTADGERLPRASLLGLGALFAVSAVTSVYALERVAASTYTVLLYTYPAIVALLLFATGEPLSRRAWSALALTLIGVLLTVRDLGAALRADDVTGVLLAIGNGAAYAVYIVISGRVLRGRRAMMTASAYSMTGTLITFTVLALLRGGLSAPQTDDGWAILAGVGLISTALPIFAFYAGMRHVGPGQAAILSTLEPVVVLLLSALLLGETMTVQQLIGAALILAATVLLQWRRASAAHTRLKPQANLRLNSD